MTKQIEADLHEQIEQQRRWSQMSPAQKRKKLFQNQKEILDKFLERHAISQSKYDTSLRYLQKKRYLQGRDSQYEKVASR